MTSLLFNDLNTRKILSLIVLCVFMGASIGAIFLVPIVHAQPINSAVSKPRSFNNSFQLVPQVMPSSLTDIATLTGGPPAGKDVYLCYIDMSTASTASTFTIQDKQTPTPVPFATSVAIAADSVYSPLIAGHGNQSMVQTCRWFPKGVSVQAGNASAISFYMSGYWQ